MTLTLSQWLEGLVVRYGPRTAFVFNEEPVTFGDLARRSQTIAGGLHRQGIGKGDPVAIWCLNRPDWIASFFACAHLGAPAIAVNTRFREAELVDLLDRICPKAIVYQPEFGTIDFTGLMADAAKAASAPPPIEVLCGEGAPPHTVTLDDIAESAPEIATGNAMASDPAIMFTTSGTTSLPKCVVHPHASIIQHAEDVAADFGMAGPDAVMLQALPYCGVFGFCQAMASLAAGRPSIVTETFDGPTAAALIAAHAVTHFNATDDMLRAIVDTPRPVNLKTLRLVGAASFNRGPEALAEISDTTGLPLVGLYGMSEILALFARRSIDDEPAWRHRAGGRPVSPSSRVRVRDPDNGNLCAIGEVGEIEISGPSRFSAYAGDQAATDDALTPDDFVRTGDLGFLDETGGFTFESRIGDALRLGGFLVNPAEISGFIEGIEGISGCVVVGVSAGDRLRAAAFVTADDQPVFDEEAILSRCRASLAPFKVPVLVRRLAVFPMADGPNGLKIQLGELRETATHLLGG